MVTNVSLGAHTYSYFTGAQLLRKQKSHTPDSSSQLIRQDLDTNNNTGEADGEDIIQPPGKPLVSN